MGKVDTTATENGGGLWLDRVRDASRTRLRLDQVLKLEEINALTTARGTMSSRPLAWMINGDRVVNYRTELTE